MEYKMTIALEKTLNKTCSNNNKDIYTRISQIHRNLITKAKIKWKINTLTTKKTVLRRAHIFNKYYKKLMISQIKITL